jgi:hypothetical protein
MKYPWKKIELYDSFVIDAATIKFRRLAVTAFKYGLMYDREFKIVYKRDDKVYEITRIK